MSGGGGAAPPRVELTVRVEPPYPIRVGPGVLGDVPELLPERRVAVISDETVAGLHASAAIEALQADGREVVPLTVPAGEGSKRMEVAAELLGALARAGVERGDAVLAVGGGVVTDLAGFVAATYLRGVKLVQAPTSLLAMVDAAIGGKTGVNLPEGKNLVGAFWQPRAVLIDVEALRTLPPRVLRQGAVEAFKAGLLADAELARAVASGALSGEAPAERLTRLVAASARIKAEVVARDEREAGERAHLNLGHTLAHALEAVSGHALAHGDAVAYGLMAAAQLSRSRGGQDVVPSVRALWAWLRPEPLPTREWERLLPYLGRDKKVRAGRRRWVLLEAIGRPYLAEDVVEDEERAAWRAVLAEADTWAASARACTPGGDDAPAREGRENE